MTWPRIKLDTIKADARYALVGGPFGSNLTTRDYVDEGVPVIRGNNLPGDSVFFDDDFVFVSEQKADDLVANTAYPGDVIFTQRGTLGQVGVIPPEAKFPRYIISQSQMKLSVDPEKAAARFVYYFFRMPSTVQSVSNHALTSGVPHINLSILKEFQIQLPPVPAQWRIVDILSAYDDLIENNRRRMALLEEAARQIYRDWFVRLRFPGYEHTRIINGVPEGWERRPLEGCVTFRSGGTPSKQRSDYWEGDIPWVSSGEMTETRLYDMPLHVSQEAAEDGSRLAPAGTILIVVRGMSLAKECRISVVTRDMTFNQDLKALVCKPDVDSEFLFHSLRAVKEYLRDLATEASHGTKKLDMAVLERLPILVPQLWLQRRFRENLDSLNAQRDNLHWQNKKLRTARNLLLLRLMSGEIAV